VETLSLERDRLGNEREGERFVTGLETLLVRVVDLLTVGEVVRVRLIEELGLKGGGGGGGGGGDVRRRRRRRSRPLYGWESTEARRECSLPTPSHDQYPPLRRSTKWRLTASPASANPRSTSFEAGYLPAPSPLKGLGTLVVSITSSGTVARAAMIAGLLLNASGVPPVCSAS
jgi:hypothetical protein